MPSVPEPWAGVVPSPLPSGPAGVVQEVSASAAARTAVRTAVGAAADGRGRDEVFT
ncbi:hypothetical protein ACFFX0_09195 [Citricoccus parietis]|uniref:Uncharacterized protein n=1 Tax=Citricoccus parietis TaxID=592307 RepID=A0ABV5FXF6_9MICC